MKMKHAVSIPFRNRAIWLVLSLGIATSIAVLMLMPQAITPKGPQGMDKLYHALAFAALALPTGLLRPDFLRYVASLTIAHGALLELVQSQIGRSAELGDLLADGLGVMVGIGIGITLRLVLFPRPSPRKS